MRRFMKGLRRGEKGFTLIELLIVVAILGILAAVIVPNLTTMLTTGKVAAANTEVANVESAALAYYADYDGNWPGSDDDLVTGDYLDGDPTGSYGFDDYGKVGGTSGTPANGASWGTNDSVVWNDTDHEWQRA